MGAIIFVFFCFLIKFRCIPVTIKRYKRRGEGQGQHETSLSKQEYEVGKGNTPACHCAIHVKWLERHPSCSYTVRIRHFVTVSTNSCSCHQTTQCLSIFDGLNSKHILLYCIFLHCQKLANIIPYIFPLFPYLLFHKIL